MAGYGFGTGLLQGLQVGSRLVGDAMDARDVAYARGIAARRQEGLLADEQLVRDDAAQERGFMQQSMNKVVEQPADEFGGGPPQTKVNDPWIAAEETATKLMSAGRAKDAEKWLDRSAAMKSFYSQRALQEAFSTQDPQAVVAVAKRFVPGTDFAVEQGKDGTLVGTIRLPNGNEFQQPFSNFKEFAATVNQMLSPGDLTKLYKDEIATRAGIQKQRTEDNFKRAQANQADAQAQKYRAEAGVEEEKAKTPERRNAEYLMELGVDQDQALAIVSGKAAQGKLREQTIADIASKMMNADAQSITGGKLTVEEAINRATQIVDGAASAGGAERAGQPRKGAGMGGLGPKPAAKRDPLASIPEDERRGIAQVQAAYRAGQITRAQAEEQLRAFGINQ